MLSLIDVMNGECNVDDNGRLGIGDYGVVRWKVVRGIRHHLTAITAAGMSIGNIHDVDIRAHFQGVFRRERRYQSDKCMAMERDHWSRESECCKPIAGTVDSANAVHMQTMRVVSLSAKLVYLNRGANGHHRVQ